MHQKIVGIVQFNAVEVRDYCGPFEVFSVTRLDESRRREQPSPFQVMLVAQTEQPIVTTGGMRVLPEVSFAHCPPLDSLVVPSGWGDARREAQPGAAALRDRPSPACEHPGRGLHRRLDSGRGWPAGWRSRHAPRDGADRLHELFPRAHVDRASHVVEDGAVLTAAGIAAGIDLALKVGWPARTAKPLPAPPPATWNTRFRAPTRGGSRWNPGDRRAAGRALLRQEPVAASHIRHSYFTYYVNVK